MSGYFGSYQPTTNNFTPSMAYSSNPYQPQLNYREENENKIIWVCHGEETSYDKTNYSFPYKGVTFYTPTDKQLRSRALHNMLGICQNRETEIWETQPSRTRNKNISLRPANFIINVEDADRLNLGVYCCLKDGTVGEMISGMDLLEENGTDIFYFNYDYIFQYSLKLINHFFGNNSDLNNPASYQICIHACRGNIETQSPQTHRMTIYDKKTYSPSQNLITRNVTRNPSYEQYMSLETPQQSQMNFNGYASTTQSYGNNSYSPQQSHGYGSYSPQQSHFSDDSVDMEMGGKKLKKNKKRITKRKLKQKNKTQRKQRKYNRPK
jgi:hypothetical protein